MRRFILSLATLLVACQTPPAHAHAWSSAQLADLAAIATNGSEGLAPPAEAYARFVRAVEDNTSVLDREAAADGLFHQLVIQYAQGVVLPESLDDDWHIERPPAPDSAALDARLAAGALPSALLHELTPHSAEYIRLRAELQRLRLADPGSSRIAQLRVNLERWRWLPRTLPERRVEVRLAEFRLYLNQPDAPRKAWSIIVGARRSPSPVFEAPIRSITLNPYWTPPRTIVANELAPRFQRNPNLAAAEGFDVFDADGQSVDPNSVDWGLRPFPYRLRQRPGPGNALGLIRMDLPNPFAVYLHDTPGRALFERDNRALSHGCIRVQNPFAFAAALDPGNWNEQELQRQADAGEQISLTLSAPMPSYILYFTTAIGETGEIVYLSDIYRRDRAILRALDGDIAVPAFTRNTRRAPREAIRAASRHKARIRA